MRPAVLAAFAVSTALVSVGAGSACSGGYVSSFDPLNTRDTPPSSYDTPPTTHDTPPSSYDTPPSMTDTPPVVGDPANQAGGGACVPCSGTYVCSATEVSSQTVTVMLTPATGGGCDVSGVSSSSGQSFDGFPACGTGVPTSGTDDGVYYSVSRVAGGGFKLCLQVDAGTFAFSGCATCVLTTETVGSTTPSESSSGVGISVGQSSASSGGGCSALESCCGSVPSLDQPSCHDTVNDGNSQACTDALTGFQQSNLCP